MVRGTERAGCEEWTLGVGQAGDAVDGARHEDLVRLERWQDRRDRPCEHRLPRSRWPDEQQVVPAGGRDLEGPLGSVLAGDVAEIHVPDRIRRRSGRRRRGETDLAVQVLHRRAKRPQRVRIAAERRRFRRVLGRQVGAPDRSIPRSQDPRHHAADRADRPVERELTEAEPVDVGLQLIARPQDRQSDGEVESRALLASLGGGQIDDDPAQRELESRIADRRSGALTRLAHRRVRKPNDREAREAVRDVRLDRYQCRLEPPQRARLHVSDP